MTFISGRFCVMCLCYLLFSLNVFLSLAVGESAANVEKRKLQWEETVYCCLFNCGRFNNCLCHRFLYSTFVTDY